MHLQQFDRLVLIGSPGDMAWLHSILTPDASCRIIAEIQYPLMPSWFNQPTSQEQMIQALNHVFSVS